MPPSLLPFIPRHHLTEGTRFSLACTVTKGDLPLTFLWTKNGALLDHDVVVKSLDDFNDYLSITQIKVRHSGNYSCSVMNAAATVQITTSVKIDGELNKSYIYSNNTFFTFQCLQESLLSSFGHIPRQGFEFRGLAHWKKGTSLLLLHG